MVALLLASPLMGGRAGAAPLGVRAGVSVDGSPRFEAGLWSLDFRLLTDDGAPLPLSALIITLPDGPSRSAVTDAEGGARVVVPTAAAAEGAVRWTVSFLGTALHAPAEFSGVADLSRVPVGLYVTTSEGALALGSPPASVHVRLETRETRPKRLSDTVIRIRLGDGPFQFANTGPMGDLDFVLQPDILTASLPAPGPVSVEVVFDGDAAFGSARATAVIERRVLARVTLRVAREGDAASGRLRFSGRASHEFGTYPDALVRLSVVDDAGVPRLDLPALSGPDGIWNASISLETLRGLGVSRVAVRAQLAPQGQIAAARSEMLRLEVPKLPGRSVLWPAVGLLAVLIVVRLLSPTARRAVATFFARIPARVGRAIAAMISLAGSIFRRSGRGGEQLLGGTQGPVEPAARLVGAPAPRRDVMAIAIRDRDTGLALHALAEVLEEGGQVVATATGDSLEFHGSPGTRYTVTLSGEGLLPVSFAVSFPHDGALDGAVVRMRRVERRLRELHEETARRHGEEPAWGHATPREVEDRIRARGPRGAARPQVAALVASVEKAYFAPHPPTAADVEAIEAALHEPPSPKPEGP